nr:MAG TPA: hypothetical protein [Caudoviricetes sp.]
MRDVLEAMHDYPDEALGLFFFLIDRKIVLLLSGVFEKKDG